MHSNLISGSGRTVPLVALHFKGTAAWSNFFYCVIFWLSMGLFNFIYLSLEYFFAFLSWTNWGQRMESHFLLNWKIFSFRVMFLYFDWKNFFLFCQFYFLLSALSFLCFTNLNKISFHCFFARIEKAKVNHLDCIWRK